jgi:hypothetical protein
MPDVRKFSGVLFTFTYKRDSFNRVDVEKFRLLVKAK